MGSLTENELRIENLISELIKALDMEFGVVEFEGVLQRAINYHIELIAEQEELMSEEEQKLKELQA